MRHILQFTASGVPQSKGSMTPNMAWRAIVAKTLNTFGHRDVNTIKQSLKRCNIPLVASNKKTLDPWMRNLEERMRAAHEGPPLVGSFVLTGHFFMPRPQQHYSMRNGKKYRDESGRYVIKDRFLHANPNTKPDVDKLLRAVFDAGEGIIWANDSQIISACMPKRYANGMPGVICNVWMLNERELPPEPEQMELFKI